jgi:Uma2 family endonuclease
MRAMFQELPSWIVEGRRLRGDDRRDEVWEGVLHVAPQPVAAHQLLATQLGIVLSNIARGRGLWVVLEPGHYQPGVDNNYRVPDVALFANEHLADRGIEGRAELVIEILSPHDESREKLPFYAKVGTPEAWLIAPRTCELEVFDLRGGHIRAVSPRADGAIESPTLGLVMSVTPGPRLEIRDGDDVHVIVDYLPPGVR